MTVEQFMKHVEERQGVIYETLGKGYAEYTEGAGPFGNFIIGAERTGMPRNLVWLVYAHKHFEGICRYLRNGKVQRETIQSRIVDLQAYLHLLDGMLREDEQREKSNTVFDEQIRGMQNAAFRGSEALGRGGVAR